MNIRTPSAAMDVLTATVRFLRTQLRELRTLSFNFLIIELALKYYMDLMPKPEGKSHLKELRIDGTIIL